MFRTARDVFARLARTMACPPILTSARVSPVVKARLRLNALEAREVPATFVWTNETRSSLASDPDNWKTDGTPGTLPGAEDVVVFSYIDPDWDGDPKFQPRSPDCIDLTSRGTGDGRSFAGMYLDASYNGTVYFGEALTTESYSQYGGAIAQDGGGEDLTVTHDFTWTGGTLNSALTGANVFLAGAVGTIDPGAGNSITSGSTLVLNPRNGIGASLTLLPGEMALAAGRGLEANALCMVNVTAGSNDGAAVTIFGNPDEDFKKIVFNRDSGLVVDGGPWNGRNLILENNGGHIIFNELTRSTFGPAGAVTEDKAFIRQLAGTMILHKNTEIAAQGQQQGGNAPAPKAFMELSGGRLVIHNSNGLGLGVSKLIGNLRFSGGQIGFSGDYGIFEVEGSVKWTGGVYSPRLKVTSNGLGDAWVIRGELDIPNSAAVQVQPATDGYIAPPQGTGVNANFRWEVLIFDSVKLDPNNAVPPAIGTAPGSAEMYWLPAVEDGKTKWRLAWRGVQVGP